MSIEDKEGIKLALTNMSKQINERLDNHDKLIEDNFKILDDKICDIQLKNNELINRFENGETLPESSQVLLL